MKKFCIFFCLGLSWSCWGGVDNALELQQRLGLGPELERLRQGERGNPVVVAVLDNGFAGFKASQWPGQTELVQRYSTDFLRRHPHLAQRGGNPLAATDHGLRMAQIVMALSTVESGGAADGAAPKLYLLNAHGLTQFRRAVAYAIEKGVDVILYSQIWEYGGNFDGTGFINSVVTQATEKGILWINAAGNEGGQVVNHQLNRQQLSAQAGSTLARYQLQAQWDRSPVALTLSWNDFAERENYQTQLDLDLVVKNAAGEVIGRAQKSQLTGESLHGREQLRVLLNRGQSEVEVIYRGGSFPPVARFRLLARPQGKAVALLQAQRTREIFIPADHRQVLAVGDHGQYSSQGPTMDGRSKPDLKLPPGVGAVAFSDGQKLQGTSGAAAMMAGLVALKGQFNPLYFQREFLKNYFSYAPIIHSLRQVLGRWVRFERGGGGKVVIKLQQSPLQIPRLFDNARAAIGHYRLRPGDFRYFLRSVPAAWGQPFNLASHYAHRSLPLQLPQLRGAGPWVELSF